MVANVEARKQDYSGRGILFNGDQELGPVVYRATDTFKVVRTFGGDQPIANTRTRTSTLRFVGDSSGDVPNLLGVDLSILTPQGRSIPVKLFEAPAPTDPRAWLSVELAYGESLDEHDP